jgi:hypothetical protein
MRRWSAPLGLGLLVVASGVLVFRERDAQSTASPVGGAPSASVANAPAPSTTGTEVLAPATAEAVKEPANASVSARRTQSFELLEDGSPVPALDLGAPRRVKLGVALFRYRGAEGAGAQSRTREEAERLALAALAKGGDDFGQVVALGDPGSAVDVGWVGRGVLERSVEHAAFTAKVGETLPRPVDTPRGFWIVRRHK